MTDVCYKCAGAGIFTKFAHIEGGKCFACSGTGKRGNPMPREVIWAVYAVNTQTGKEELLQNIFDKADQHDGVLEHAKGPFWAAFAKPQHDISTVRVTVAAR